LRNKRHIRYTAFHRFGGIGVRPIKEIKNPSTAASPNLRNTRPPNFQISVSLCATRLQLARHQPPLELLLQHLCRPCGLAASEISGDTKEKKTDGDNEDNAEDHNYTGFLASPVTLGELVSGIAHLERLQSGDGCHFEGFIIKSQH
jgi:hypothetical protein